MESIVVATLVVAGRSCALERERVLLFDTAVSVLGVRLPIAVVEVKYAAPVLLVRYLLVHIQDCFLSQDPQLFLLLGRCVTDYYVVQNCFIGVLQVRDLQIMLDFEIFDVVVIFGQRSVRIVNLGKLHVWTW